jgi:hypothetical protein
MFMTFMPPFCIASESITPNSHSNIRDATSA